MADKDKQQFADVCEQAENVGVPTPPGKSWKNILESHAFF